MKNISEEKKLGEQNKTNNYGCSKYFGNDGYFWFEEPN